MRILMLLPRFPYPPDRGDTLRSWAVLSSLAARHEVWLACVDHVPPRPEHLEYVRRRCAATAVVVRSSQASFWRGVGALVRGRSLTEGYFDHPGFAETVRHWSETVPFDALFTYSSSIAAAAEHAVVNGRRILDLGDVDSVKWVTYARRSLPPLRWLLGVEARRVGRLEERAVWGHDLCLLVNERERQKLQNRMPRAETAVLPTTIDLDEYPPSPLPGAGPAGVVGMVGSMFYPPNVRAVNWFGRYVWPRVRAQVPRARWLIVGSRPVRSVQRWGRCPDVTVTGYVADVRPYLASMRVFVDAVDGDIGVQSKVIVALAAGRACVVTPDCAAGIDHGDPPPFLTAVSPAAFAEAVVRLLRDDAQARALAARARAVAAAHYSTQSQMARLENWLAGDAVRAEGFGARADAAGVNPEVLSV